MTQFCSFLWLSNIPYTHTHTHIYIPHLYPFIWTFRFLLCPGHCKYCCNEHWGTCVFFELWFSQGICPVVGLLGHMVVLFPVSQGISILFSLTAVLVYIPANNVGGFPFLHTLSSIYYLQTFWWWSSHSDQCEMIPHCSFDLHFSNNEQW